MPEFSSVHFIGPRPDFLHAEAEKEAETDEQAVSERRMRLLRVDLKESGASRRLHHLPLHRAGRGDDAIVWSKQLGVTELVCAMRRFASAACTAASYFRSDFSDLS